MADKKKTIWSELGEGNCSLLSGHEYMVAEDTGTGGCRMLIARWFNAGDTVDLDAEMPELRDADSEDKKLVESIMGSKIDVKVEKDGFFIVTSDERLMNGTTVRPDGAVEGLTCIADCDTEGIYWTELPVAPKGLRHPNDMYDALQREIADNTAQFNRSKQQGIMEFKDSNNDFENVKRNYLEFMSNNEETLDLPEEELDNAIIISIMARHVRNIICDEASVYLVDKSDLGHPQSMDKLNNIIKEAFESVDPHRTMIKFRNGLMIKSFIISTTLDSIRGDEPVCRETVEYYRNMFVDMDDMDFFRLMKAVENFGRNIGEEGDYNELICIVLDFMM